MAIYTLTSPFVDYSPKVGLIIKKCANLEQPNCLFNVRTAIAFQVIPLTLFPVV